jgi:hypothetical protein
VGPHCVQFDEGMPPEIPAGVQSVARVGANTLDQLWASEICVRHSSKMKMNEIKRERFAGKCSSSWI